MQLEIRRSGIREENWLQREIFFVTLVEIDTNRMKMLRILFKEFKKVSRNRVKRVRYGILCSTYPNSIL